MKKHLALLVRFHGETTGVMRFRKFFGWYAKGMAIKHLKVMAFNACTHAEMLRLLEEIGTSQAERYSGDSKYYEAIASG
jgi:hypothetical protein